MDMIDQMMEHMPWLTKLNYNIRESIYSFFMSIMVCCVIPNITKE